MLAATPPPIFRVRSTRGVLTMRELREFAAFIDGMLGKSITVEGFDSAQAQPDGVFVVAAKPVTQAEKQRSVTLRRAEKSAYQFPREGGLALWPQLRAYHRHIWPQVREMKIRGNVIKNSIKDSRGVQHLQLAST